MSYTTPNRLLMPGRQSIDTGLDSWIWSANAISAGGWPAANLAIYVPLRVSSRVVVRSLWFSSGSGTTGYVDMGLYDASGVEVIAAGTAAKVLSVEQVFNTTDTTVGPGTYYIGLSCDNSSDLFWRFPVGAAPVSGSYGVRTQTSAYPLPATATFTLDQTYNYVPLMGVFIEATAT